MRVLLVPNLAKPTVLPVVCELATWLVGQGIDPVLARDDADACGLGSYGVPASDIGEPTLTVALGGDGTILKAVHLLDEVESPVLGVNMGRLGFLSGATAEHDLRDAVSSALAGEGRIERRSTLEAKVVMEGRSVGRYRALNEVYVGRGPAGRVVEIDLAVNGLSMTRFSSDGVIVATPTGSTAYALSAGGPIVSPDVGCLIVVPVAAHTLAARSLITGPADEIEIRLPNPARREACLQVDGDMIPCRQSIESVSVRRGERDVMLVKLDGRDFYDVVRTEFLGG